MKLFERAQNNYFHGGRRPKMARGERICSENGINPEITSFLYLIPTGGISDIGKNPWDFRSW